MGCRTIEAYDASAQDTLLVGRYFEFYDDDAGEQRVGCFDQTSGRFVVLDADDQIVSHFLTHVGYIRWLPGTSAGCRSAPTTTG